MAPILDVHVGRRPRHFAHVRFAGVGLVGLALVAAACSTQQSHESVSNQGQAIVNGLTDFESGDPWRNSSLSIGGCSGTLITPIHVLTANHCVTGATATAIGWTVNGSPLARFGVNPGSSWNGSAQRQVSVVANAVQHTGPVFASGDRATDIAIVTLQFTPVLGSGAGNWNVAPVHPLDPAYPCPTTINPLISGFGATTWPCGGPSPTRQYNTLGGVTCPANDICTANFGSGTYGGTLFGDSGGPMFLGTGLPTKPYVLCAATQGGDASRCNLGNQAPTNCTWAPMTFVDKYFDNAAFIKNVAWDFKHNSWFGEGCAGVDDDGDGIPSACDNCKYIRNVLQTDSNGNGIGDACDNCATAHPFSNQRDSNREAETQINASLGIGGPTWQPLSGERGDLWLTMNYPGDQCDTFPITTAEPTSLAYPSGRTVSSQLSVCGQLSAPQPIDVTVGNLIDEESHVGSLAFAKEVGWTRPMRCVCTKTQLECEQQNYCGRSNVAANLDFGWAAMTIDDASTRSQISAKYTVGSQFQTGIQTEYWSIHPKQGNKAFGRGWGWRYWAGDIYVPPPTYGTFPIFDGLLWSWVRRYDPGAAGGFLDPATGDPATQQPLRQYVASTMLSVKEVGQPVTTLPCNVSYKLAHWPTDGGCPMCGTPVLSLDASDPNPWGTAALNYPGYAPVAASSKLTLDLVTQLLSSSKKVFMSKDPKSLWKGSVAGVIVATDTHAPAYRVSVNGGGSYSLAPATGMAGQGPLVAAASGRRQEMAFFGETDPATGKVLNQARIYDFDLDAYRTARILGTKSLVSPKAATYRSEDDSYYVLDAATFDSDVVVNNGLENGNLYAWTATGPSTSVLSSGAHSGTYAARLGSTSPTAGDSSISQTFTAPTGATSLSFWYQMTCPDTVYYDWATATLTDNTTSTVATVLPKICTTNRWTRVSATITPGHSYTLTLTNRDDAYPGDASYTLFDDVGLDSAASMRLVKINRGMSSQVVGEWPRSGAMSTFGLTSGANGSLVVSCWSAASYTVGELVPDPFDAVNTITQFVEESPAPGQYVPPNALHLRGLYTGQGSLALGAQRELRGVSVWVAGASAPKLLAFGSNPNPADLAFSNLSACF